MMDFVWLFAGLVLLTAGGEAVVRGALAAADRVGISPLLAGLVIVGFGTSSPELVVSIGAALADQPDIAVGNVVGSNISNTLLILGTCALIAPLTTTRGALGRDGTTVLLASLIFVGLGWGGLFGRIDGAICLVAMAIYLGWAYWSESKGKSPASEIYQAEADEMKKRPASTWATIAALVLGLVALVGGAQLLVMGATGIAERLGVPEAVIGLTVVAVGTSLPEFAVSALAAIRGHVDVAVGNILGSNIFNVLAILGVTALLSPLPLNERILDFDQWVLVGSSALLLLFLATGLRLSRLEGAVFFALYVGYVALSFTVLA